MLHRVHPHCVGITYTVLKYILTITNVKRCIWHILHCENIRVKVYAIDLQLTVHSIPLSLLKHNSVDIILYIFYEFIIFLVHVLTVKQRSTLPC